MTKGVIFARRGLGYALTMDGIAAEIQVGRLSKSRGEYHGMLRVSSALPGVRAVNGVLFQARENLSSDTARKRVAKALDQRTNGAPIDWMVLLDQFCLEVLSAETAGAPIETIGPEASKAELTWRLDPIIPTGKPVILYGEGGVGKSTLAAAFAVSVETGVTIIEGITPRKGPVLYLDWESDRDEVNDRVRGVAAGANLPSPASIAYRACAGPLSEQVEEVARAVTERRLALVIVDSIGLAAGTSADGADAAESALRLFASFRVLAHAWPGCAILAIDHVSKSEAEVTGRPSRPYGSIYKLNLARAMFEVKRAGNTLALYNTKSNIRALLPPLALRVTHSEGGAITYTSLDDMPQDLSKALHLVDQIANVLRRGNATIEDIALAIGAKEGSIKTTLYGHRDMFSRLPSKAWELLPEARAKMPVITISNA